MAPVGDSSSSSQGHIEAEFAHALGNLRAFLDGQLAFQPQPTPSPIALPSMSNGPMITGQPVVGDATAFQRAHIQTLRSLEQWSTVLNDYLNLLDGCCASHPVMRQRVSAITRRLLRLQLSGNLPQPTAALYPVPMTGSTAMHAPQIRRNLPPVSAFNDKRSGHLGSAFNSGPGTVNCVGVRGSNHDMIDTSPCSGVPNAMMLPKAADRRGQGDTT